MSGPHLNLLPVVPKTVFVPEPGPHKSAPTPVAARTGRPVALAPGRLTRPQRAPSEAALGVKPSRAWAAPPAPPWAPPTPADDPTIGQPLLGVGFGTQTGLAPGGWGGLAQRHRVDIKPPQHP